MAVYDADRTLLAGWYGSVPPDFLPAQVARDGEDFAVLMAARHLAGTFTLYTDCAGTLSCSLDPLVGSRPSNTRAHLWAQAHGVGGLEGMVAKKVPAHATVYDVREGKLTAFERDGNHKADALAKQGAALVRHTEADRLLLRGFLSLARSALKFMARAEAHYGDQEVLTMVSLEAPSGPDALPEGSLMFGIRAPPGAEEMPPPGCPAEACPPDPGSQAPDAPWLCGGHCLWEFPVRTSGAPQASLLFCTTCGEYATTAKNSRGLKGHCLGQEQSLHGSGKKNSDVFARLVHPNRAHKLGPHRSPGDFARRLFGPRWSGLLSEQGQARAAERGRAAPRFVSPPPLCLSDVCQCFGLNEERARTLGLEARRRDPDPLDCEEMA